jgi:hypothetical protein
MFPGTVIREATHSDALVFAGRGGGDSDTVPGFSSAARKRRTPTVGVTASNGVPIRGIYVAIVASDSEAAAERVVQAL